LEQENSSEYLATLEQEFKKALESADVYWEEAYGFTKEHLSLDPTTLGLDGYEDKNIDQISVDEKAVVGKTIWKYFGLPHGKNIKDPDVMVDEKKYPADEDARVEGEIRKRVFRTNRENILIHELLFSDKQKRFLLEVVQESDQEA
jgi:hypothetical protein